MKSRSIAVGHNSLFGVMIEGKAVQLLAHGPCVACHG